MTSEFERIAVGDEIRGLSFAVSRETIRAFAEASLDWNPLHFDEKYMDGSFGGTRFGGVIAHGMATFAQMTRMMTDWLLPRGGIHRRLQTRWLRPVRPGDTIVPHAVVRRKVTTAKAAWLVLELDVTNQAGERVASGEAMAEFPLAE